MWRKSDERRVRKLFRTVQQEPAPDRLCKGLQVDIEARFVAPAVPRIGLFWRALRPKPLLVGAVGLLVAALVGVLLTIPRSPDVIAAVLEAMEQVKTAHVIGPHFDIWISADHGTREERSGWVRIAGVSATWLYFRGENRVVISDPQPNAAHEMIEDTLKARGMLAQLETAPPQDHVRYRVTDATLNGTPAKRIEFEAHGYSGVYYIDADSMRIVTGEVTVGPETGAHKAQQGRHQFRVEYNSGVDPALFTFEPPEGANVVDTRTDSKLAETADNIPIEKNPDFARELIDAVYAGSLSTVADSLDEPTRRYHPDWVIAGTAAVLRQQFGTVKDLEFQSIRPVQQFWVEAVWAVIAEHGSFKMKLIFDPEGKVAGVWFRFPPDVEWATAAELGVDYVKQRKKEASAQNGD